LRQTVSGIQPVQVEIPSQQDVRRANYNTCVAYSRCNDCPVADPFAGVHSPIAMSSFL
jgi:hypothetical protein